MTQVSMPFLLLLLLLASPLAAQEVQSGDVVVRKLAGLPVGATHGYHEIAFLVTNRSPTRAHRVRIEIPDVGSVTARPIGRLERTVDVGPSTTVRLALHQPALPLAGHDARVFVDGRRLPEAITLHSAHPHPWTYYGPTPGPTGAPTELAATRVLVSQGVDTGALPESDDPSRYLMAAGVDAWSGDWLAYSGYDGVVLTARELAEADARVQSALWRYAEAGGTLLALGPPAALGDRLPAVESTGLGITYTGFGVVMAAPGPLEAGQLARLARAWEQSSEAWSLAGEPETVHRLMPVLDDVRVPMRGIFLMVLAFAVLIGPVNLYVLARRRRRIWLLWTVPAAALAACAAIFLYTLFDEGLLRSHRSASLTVLDERTQRAATLGWLGYYSTLTPAGGLRFERDTEVTAVVSRTHGGTGGGPRTLDLTEGQHLASGWVSARLPAYFVARRNALRRERLALHRTADGGLEATNGLGADVSRLHLADADGVVHRAGHIAAGETGPLAADPAARARGRPEMVRDLYQADLPSRLRFLEDDVRAYLQPGTYVAVLARDPFLEPAMDGLRETTRQALVYGYLAEVP